jgi:hypothetical protein
MPAYVMAHRDPDGRPAFQPVSDRHRDEPGVIPASEVAGLDEARAEELATAADQHRKSLGRKARKRQQKIHGKGPAARAAAQPVPYFGWEVAEGDQINVWFRELDGDGNDVWVPHSSLVQRWDDDSNDWIVVKVLVDKELIRAAIARGDAVSLAPAKPFPRYPGDLQFGPVPWQP